MYKKAAADRSFIEHVVGGTERKAAAGLGTDFASRSLHEMTVKTKAVIATYYGEPQNYAYWNGCSTGGRCTPRGFRSALYS